MRNLMVFAALLLAACDPYPLTFEAPRDAGADASVDVVPAERECSSKGVVTIGACGVYRDKDSTSCPLHCTFSDDTSAYDPACQERRRVVLGAVLCMNSEEECDRICE